MIRRFLDLLSDIAATLAAIERHLHALSRAAQPTCPRCEAQEKCHRCGRTTVSDNVIGSTGRTN